MKFNATPRKTKAVALRDFTGGVNYRADQFQLHESESPDMKNVDVSPDGGFQMRGTVGFVNSTSLVGTPLVSLWAFTTSGGTQQVMVGHSTKTQYTTGANFTDTGTTWTVADRQEAVVFNDLCYIQNGTDAPRKWTGAAISNLTQTFNNNIAAPDNGDMPIARHITAHMGYVWIAWTKESGTNFKNRVRFSFPNGAEDWRTNDYIDIDIGREGDEIQRIIPFKDRLIIFKQKSVHAIVGYSPETFAVVPITYSGGAVGPEALCSSEDALYWFSWPNGIFKYDGKKIDWLFNNIYPKIQDGSIPDTASQKISCSYLKRRLWVSVPYSGTSVNARTFVWDPALKSRGSPDGGWMPYDFGVGAMIQWTPIGQLAMYLGLHTSTGKLLKFEQSANTDDFGAGAVQVPTYFATRWVDDDIPAQRKRFRRADFVVDSDIFITYRVQVYRDYDPSRLVKEFTFDNFVVTATTPLWDAVTWDNFLWGEGAAPGQKIVRGPSIGQGRSAQFVINGPTTSKRFGVNAIIFKYIPKAIR